MARNCIGLDIGSSSVKLVQLKPRRKNLVLNNFGIEPLPAQVIVDGAVMNHGALVDAIRSLTERIHLRGKRVALAVSGTSVIIKRITMPDLDDDKLAEQMEWEIRQNIPFNRDEVVVDHVAIRHGEGGQMEVLLVAAKKDVVDQYVHVVRDAGLQPVIVDAAAFAAQNAVEASVGLSAEKAIGLINVGATVSTISVIEQGYPVFTREIGVGGNTYTEVIQQRLSIGMEGAEAYKVGGGTEGTEDVVPQEVHQILEQVSEQIAGEFQRTINFFGNSSAEKGFEAIYLTGGSSLVPQLPDALQTRLNMDVKVLNPFESTRVDPKRFDTEYLNHNAPVATIAFGLALRQQGDT